MGARYWFGTTWLIAMLVATTGWAQSTTGSIQGLVRDAQGALPGVTVTIRNIDTQLLRATVTNETGGYDAQLLPPGEYTIAADLTGFRQQQRNGVRLTVNQAARIDLELQLSAVQESVTVTGAAPLVNRSTAPCVR